MTYADFTFNYKNNQSTFDILRAFKYYSPFPVALLIFGDPWDCLSTPHRAPEFDQTLSRARLKLH